MSVTIPISDREPRQIASGDNVSWTKAFADYPATDWSLTYVIRSKKNIYTFAGTATGAVFTVTLTTADTAGWKPGEYVISAIVTASAGSQQKQVKPSFPRLTVTPNLLAKPNGEEAITFAARMVKQIEETLYALAAKTVATASINGQTYSLANLPELEQLRQKYLSEVNREQAREKLNAGLGASNKIGIRFKPLNAQGYPPQVRVPWQ